MVSKTFLLLALVFATVVLITSEVAAAKELASNHDNDVEDSKYGRDKHVSYGSTRRGYNNGGGSGRYNNGGGGVGNYCRYGCCRTTGGGPPTYRTGCRCCSTLAEATAYKQANHN